MIGFYDYTVVLTYLSLLSSIFGMTQAIDGRFRSAIFCLAFSGLCDLFDGKVARSKKDRTDDEKMYGIQIDSLCDLVSFGIFPAMLFYLLGVRGTIGYLFIGYYCVCAVIRLGYFNVLEINRQKEEDGKTKTYHGLPVTTIALILPLFFLLSFIMPDKVFMFVLFFLPFVIGTLFITDFQIKKPGDKFNILQVVVGAIAVLLILFFSKYYVPKNEAHESPLIDIFDETTEETTAQ